jgi:hypothetical protein
MLAKKTPQPWRCTSWQPRFSSLPIPAPSTKRLEVLGLGSRHTPFLRVTWHWSLAFWIARLKEGPTEDKEFPGSGLRIGYINLAAWFI